MVVVVLVVAVENSVGVAIEAVGGVVVGGVVVGGVVAAVVVLTNVGPSPPKPALHVHVRPAASSRAGAVLSVRNALATQGLAVHALMLLWLVGRLFDVKAPCWQR